MNKYESEKIFVINYIKQKVAFNFTGSHSIKTPLLRLKKVQDIHKKLLINVSEQKVIFSFFLN